MHPSHCFLRIIMIHWVIALFVLMPLGEVVANKPKDPTLAATEETLVLQRRTGYKPESAETAGAMPLGVPVPGSLPGDQMLRDARVAVYEKNSERAEFIYLKLLEKEMPLGERLDILLELAHMYGTLNERVKCAAVLENFVALAKGDARMPEAYLDLGRIYRGLGDFLKAQTAFNNVLNTALAGNGTELDAFREVSLRAKIEITDTFLMTGNWLEAERYLKRLQVLDLAPKDREKVNFQAANLYFNKGEYGKAMASLRRFIDDHPASPDVCEAHFLMASTYRKLGRFDDALKEVLVLLQDDSVSTGATPEAALYWRGRAGNQIANAFYEQGDYLNSLGIYQAMVPLNPGPAWQWPVLYQIGLCFEHLRMYPKAREAYAVIIEGDDAQKPQGPPAKEPLTSNLIATQESAKWRLQQMEWALNMDESIRKLAPPSIIVSS